MILTPKQVKNYRHNPKDSTSISSDEITTLTKDGEGNILIGTYAGVLCRMNRQNGKFSRFRINTFGNLKQVDEPEQDKVTAICADNNGIIWTGTEIFGSINRLDSKTGEVRTFKTSEIKPETIVVLFSDSHDRLWAGAYLSGLILLDKKTGSIKHYTEKEGLLDNCVVGINEDKDGNIWIATTKGLSKFDVANNRFTNFPSYIGMYLILSNKLFQGVNGLLSIPVKNGVITFDPAHLNLNSVAPQVNIESVSYALAGQPDKKDSVIFTDGVQKLTLRYNENRIGFQYAALHYADATHESVCL